MGGHLHLSTEAMFGTLWPIEVGGVWPHSCQGCCDWSDWGVGKGDTLCCILTRRRIIGPRLTFHCSIFRVWSSKAAGKRGTHKMCKTLHMRGLTPSAIRPTKCLQGQKLSTCNIIFILLLHRNGGERSSVGYSQGGPGQPSGHPGGSSGHPPPVNYPSHFPNSPHNQVSTWVIDRINGN